MKKRNVGVSGRWTGKIPEKQRAERGWMELKRVSFVSCELD